MIKEIEKLIENGMSIDDILAAAKEAETKVAEKKAQEKVVEKARNKFIEAGLDYFKTMGADLSVEDCSSIKNDFSETLKEYEEILSVVLKKDILTTEETKKPVIKKTVKNLSDAEADEILDRIFKELF